MVLTIQRSLWRVWGFRLVLRIGPSVLRLVVFLFGHFIFEHVYSRATDQREQKQITSRCRGSDGGGGADLPHRLSSLARQPLGLVSSSTI